MRICVWRDPKGGIEELLMGLKELGELGNVISGST